MKPRRRKSSPAANGELKDLRAKLVELQETLDAIRAGEVDALIVNSPQGDQVYTLKGADLPYREFIERMEEGAVTLDPAGTILYCNRRFAEMLKVPLERVIGSNLLERIDPSDRARAAEMLSLRKSATANIMLHPTGSARALPVRLAMSHLEAAETEARYAVVTDLTEQHERKALADTLKKLQASQQELQKQYREVQETRVKLEAAMAAKDEFLAALSHELRTPLTPVLLMANALAVDPAVPPELRGDLEMVRRNVELEARLIDDLLDLTRITRGRLQVALQPVNLHATLALALDICEADTAAKRLRFTTQLDAANHFINADAVRLQQIFWNLIRNAVKFTPLSGRVSITTRNRRRRSGPPDIIISVTDSGIGIQPEALSRIFDAFQQASGEISRRFGGLGLGLTITRRLVELHGGTITASSLGEGRGTTMTVTLPTIAAPVGAAVEAPRIPVAPAQALRILLVEDHDDTRRNMTRLLTALRHTVVAAGNAAGALRQAAQSTFDLVVSDIGLPDESGLELMKTLHRRYGLRGICLSGYGMEEDIARSRAAGFLKHLTKPINFQQLESAIAQIAPNGNGTKSPATTT